MIYTYEQLILAIIFAYLPYAKIIVDLWGIRHSYKKRKSVNWYIGAIFFSSLFIVTDAVYYWVTLGYSIHTQSTFQIISFLTLVLDLLWFMFSVSALRDKTNPR